MSGHAMVTFALALWLVLTPPPTRVQEPATDKLEARVASLKRRFGSSIRSIASCKQQQPTPVPFLLALRELPPGLAVSRAEFRTGEARESLRVEFDAGADRVLIEAARAFHARPGLLAPSLETSSAGGSVLLARLESEEAGSNPGPESYGTAALNEDQDSEPPAATASGEARQTPRSVRPPPVREIVGEIQSLEYQIAQLEMIVPVSGASARDAIEATLCNVGFLSPRVDLLAVVPLSDVMDGVRSGPRAARFRVTAQAGGEGWRWPLARLTRAVVLVMLESVAVDDPMDPTSAVEMEFWIPIQPAWEERRPRPAAR